MANEYNPNYAVHPGRHIAELLETLSMSSDEFAGKIGVPTELLKKIIKGKASVTKEIANAMPNVYEGYSPELWLAFQSGYDQKINEAAREKTENYKNVLTQK